MRGESDFMMSWLTCSTRTTQRNIFALDGLGFLKRFLIGLMLVMALLLLLLLT
jgi:hypothetical protein